MLLLSIDLRLGPGALPLPAHLGGALKGFFEGAVMAHAPHLLDVLRARGANERANFALHAPPLAQAVGHQLRFGVVLFNELELAHAQLLRALHSQCEQRFNGREVLLERATLLRPGELPRQLLQDGLLTEEPSGAGIPALPAPLAFGAMATPQRALHELQFRSPLLLASSGVVRACMRENRPLPWPTLGQVLGSIADALCSLEPRIAQQLGLAHGWQPDPARSQLAALTPAHDPAQHMQWLYRSTPRVGQAKPNGGTAQRRELNIPGIVGTLVYPAGSDPVEHALMHWGQWCGVGQKTTMGFGSYTLGSAFAAPSPPAPMPHPPSAMISCGAP